MRNPGDKLLIGFAPPGISSPGPLCVASEGEEMDEKLLRPLVEMGYRFVEATVGRVLHEGRRSTSATT